jgi:hypothetical protein
MADFDDEKAPKKAKIAIPLRIRLAEGLIAKASQGKAEKSKSEVLTERFRLLQRSNPASILFVPSSSSSLSSESSSSLSSQSLPSNSLPSILQSFSFPDDIHTGPLISMPMIDKARILSSSIFDILDIPDLKEFWQDKAPHELRFRCEHPNHLMIPENEKNKGRKCSIERLLYSRTYFSNHLSCFV